VGLGNEEGSTSPAIVHSLQAIGTQSDGLAPNHTAMAPPIRWVAWFRLFAAGREPVRPAPRGG